MTAKKHSSSVVGFRLNAAERAKLTRLAAANERTLSGEIRAALRLHVESRETAAVA
jgi:hypothetical protein